MIVIFLWFRDYFLEKIWVLYHFLSTKLIRGKYVLIWNDDHLDYSIKIGQKLSEKADSSILFKSIRTPKEIFNFSINPSVVQAIILIVSDVTKLSEDMKIQQRIQDWLISYLEKGGGIIGGHDIIYRRVRNDKLEDAFGGRINDFERLDSKVKYIRNPNIGEHEISKSLPNSFELDDGEIIWGKWIEDTTCIFETGGDNPKPLVVSRKYMRGKLVWINSGDKKDEIARSIRLPEANLIILLHNCINWISN